jgi:hypothetical protein
MFAKIKTPIFEEIGRVRPILEKSQNQTSLKFVPFPKSLLV